MRFGGADFFYFAEGASLIVDENGAGAFVRRASLKEH